MHVLRNIEARSRIIVAVEKHYIIPCTCLRACSLAYAAHNAYTPYCDVICSLWLHHSFRHYRMKGTIFGKKVI
jgi:hypothetical protein